MRILIDGMPRTIGGIGSLLVNLADYASKQKEEDPFVFEFIIAGKSGYISFLEENGYKYYIAPSVSNIKQYKTFLARLFSENSFDYLWFNNTSKVNIFLPIYAKKSGTKVIAHTHGVDIEETGIKRVVFKILNVLNRRPMFSLIDAPVACSVEAADIYYKGNKRLRDKTVIIKNGIPVTDYTFDAVKREEIRKELDIQDDEILLGTVGRLTAVKNYPFLIELMEKLDQRYKLILIGDGEDRDMLSQMIEEKHLEDRCRLLGAKSNVADYLSAMDLFLLPSLNEGLPFSIIEAQSEGLPCVISDSLSREMAITDLAVFVPLHSLEEWVKMIKAMDLSKKREDYPAAVAKAGYNIEDSYQIFKQIVSN